MENLSEYQRLRAQAALFYSSCSPNYSAALHEMVYYPSKGFNHIIFKNPRTERTRKSQIMRFKLLRRAITLIRISTTYQEYEEVTVRARARDHTRGSDGVVTTQYWGLIAIIEERKIKVVLRRVGHLGQIHFWSIVPAWTTSKRRDIQLIRTMKGNPGED